LRKGATATRRWTTEETRARTATGPEFLHPGPSPSDLEGLVRTYEHITGDTVRRHAQRNLIAACYRVHGDEFPALVAEEFERTHTATNLLGELRVLPPRERGQVTTDPPDSTANHESPPPTEGAVPAHPYQANPDSAWCGCPEEDLVPGLLYCAGHRPVFGSAPTRRYDRRESNPAAAYFFAFTSPTREPGEP
jgi:hypothetical protein